MHLPIGTVDSRFCGDEPSKVITEAKSQSRNKHDKDTPKGGLRASEECYHQ
jgi:hypothetical protein